MATLEKKFGFNGATEAERKEGWVLNEGGATGITLKAGAWTAGSDSPNDPGADAEGGAFEYFRGGKNLTNGAPYWEWTGTLEELGVPAGATVTAINLAYDWKCQLYATGASSTAGPAELRDEAGTLLKTFSTASTYAATTAWATKAGTNQTGLSYAASKKIKLRLNGVPKTGNSNGAENRLLLDWAVVTITYEEAGGATPIPLNASSGAASATLALEAATTVPLAASTGEASATMALKAPTVVPLQAASGVASATLAVKAATTIALAASSGVASATVGVSAKTLVPLAASSGASSATLALTAPTAIPLAASSGASSATLALTAATRVPLAASSGVASATLALQTPTTIPLGASTGVAIATLNLTAETIVPLGPSSGVGSGTLVVTIPKPATLIPLAPSTGTATATLKLHAGPLVALGPSSGTATASLKITYPIPASYKVRREGIWVEII